MTSEELATAKSIAFGSSSFFGGRSASTQPPDREEDLDARYIHMIADRLRWVEKHGPNT